MLRRYVMSGLGVALAAAVALAKPGIVKTNDGASYQGDVTTDDKAVYIANKAGITTTIQRANVASVEYVASVEEQFGQQLSQLAPRDVDGRIKLARWAFDNRRYADAREALESALAIDPNNRAAVELLETTQRQMKMERATGGGGGASGGAPNPGEANGGAAPAGREPEVAPVDPRAASGKFVTPADVNAIRQAEWNQDDANVRARLKGDVKKRYLDYRASDPAFNAREFNARAAVAQAREILLEGTPDMRKDVEVLTDPASIAEFRRPAIQGRILAGCATSGCHGSTGAGGFQLISPADNEAAGYSNFVILQRYTKNVGGRVYAMVDRQSPENSLLIQYGLPADLAEVDHPAAGTYRGIYRNRQDPTYKAVSNWMGKTLALVVPDYGIDYKPPTTQPTTKPAE